MWIAGDRLDPLLVVADDDIRLDLATRHAEVRREELERGASFRLVDDRNGGVRPAQLPPVVDPAGKDSADLFVGQEFDRVIRVNDQADAVAADRKAVETGLIRGQV